MDKLLVTPSEVNEKAKEVTNIKETMLTHLDSIKTRIQNLTESDWVGAAGVAYQNQFTHLYNQAIIDGICRSAECGHELAIEIPEI